MFALLAPMLFNAAATVASAAEAPPSVTCFNGGEGKQPAGIWHWEGQKSWKRARADFAPMFAVVFRPGQERYEKADLPYCMYIPDVVGAKTVLCKTGTLEVTAFEPGRTLTGRYAFELVDGSKVENDFTAEYCEPAWPLRR